MRAPLRFWGWTTSWWPKCGHQTHSSGTARSRSLTTWRPPTSSSASWRMAPFCTRWGNVVYFITKHLNWIIIIQSFMWLFPCFSFLFFSFFLSFFFFFLHLLICEQVWTLYMIAFHIFDVCANQIRKNLEKRNDRLYLIKSNQADLLWNQTQWFTVETEQSCAEAVQRLPNF